MSASSNKHGSSTAALDITALREEFPILSRTFNDKPLIYLDNAATTQKPLCVIDRSEEHTSELQSH